MLKIHILLPINYKIEIDKDKNVLIHFNFYELNCIGGYFNYDNPENRERISS